MEKGKEVEKSGGDLHVRGLRCLLHDFSPLLLVNRAGDLQN